MKIIILHLLILHNIGYMSFESRKFENQKQHILNKDWNIWKEKDKMQ